ncbi:MAG: hypothetical protein JW793_05140 [Acidobacteria bacterium]|nr:hypothetical protein [Acidobacteriota bacterium]
MKVMVITFSIAVALGFALSLDHSGSVFAEDDKPEPEEVVAAHLESIGNPRLLAGIKNRGMSGNASVEFIQGGVGTLEGQCLVVTSGHNLSLILKYGGMDYPGEYFAYDGTDVEVATISPGQRSPLGDFIFRYNGLMKEGLLGGVWSLGWPLLDVENRESKMKYKSAKADGRELHQIDYSPKGGMNRIAVKLFFEQDTFRHVRTEYSLKVQGEQSLQAGRTVTREIPNSGNLSAGQSSITITRDAGILDQIADSHYRLVEKFDDFREVKFGNPDSGSLVLPHSYTLEYSVEGQGSSFLGRWSLTADQWMQNGTLDPSIFKVP